MDADAVGSDPLVEELGLQVDGLVLPGDLRAPRGAWSAVVFAHGSGSSRHSPRNREVAAGLQQAGIATLLFDLLTEDEAQDRRLVFDIPLLAGRLAAVVDRVGEHPSLASLPIGLFGASTGAAAALDAAAERGGAVGAVVSRGGRPDLAGRPSEVTAPALLIVGGDDREVLAMNREVRPLLGGVSELAVVDSAGHLFEGPGQLARVTDLAVAWFRDHLGGADG